MDKQFTKTQQGFSLVELVIVIIILGLLAVTALPRLLNVTEDAEDATVEGVAGGFATGVGLVRAQWELDGRPSTDPVTVKLDTIDVGVDPTSGYPTGDGENSSLISAMDADSCREVFVRILQSSPRITTDFSASDFEEFDYYASKTGTGDTSACLYHLVQTIKKETQAPTNDTVGNGFEYLPASGQVTVFTN